MLLVLILVPALILVLIHVLVHVDALEAAVVVGRVPVLRQDLVLLQSRKAVVDARDVVVVERSA